MEVDKRWVRLLSKQVQAADVELVANLCEVPLTLQQVLNMQGGRRDRAQIVTDRRVAEVDGVPVMECKCGVFNGQYALQVCAKILRDAARRIRQENAT